MSIPVLVRGDVFVKVTVSFSVMKLRVVQLHASTVEEINMHEAMHKHDAMGYAFQPLQLYEMSATSRYQGPSVV
jgi:hypothetical protein